MLGEQTEERRIFTQQERQDILKKTGCKCARCGKKLKSATMRIEHVIPISRGGTNDMKNLVPLCESCNTFKRNMLYIPSGYYSAILGTGLEKELEKMVTDWYRTIKDEFEIEKYPLIAPRYQMKLVLSDRPTKKTVYCPQLMFLWHLTGTEYKDEIKAITGCFIWYIISQTNEIHNIKNNRFDIRDVYNHEHHVAIYTLRKLTSDKVLLLAGIITDIKAHLVTVNVAWSELPKPYEISVLSNLVHMLDYTLNKISGSEIYRINIACRRKDVIKKLPYTIGTSYQDVAETDEYTCVRLILKHTESYSETYAEKEREKREQNGRDEIL